MTEWEASLRMFSDFLVKVVDVKKILQSLDMLDFQKKKMLNYWKSYHRVYKGNG